MKIKGMGIALLSGAALLGAATAQAAQPWTFGEFAYLSADGNDNFETDALELKGSIAFAQKWHGQLSYLDGESDFGSTSNDFDGFRVVVGAHPQLTPNTQLITDLSYFDYEYDDNGPDSDGFGIGLGLRHSVTEKLEVTGEVWYIDGSEGGSSNVDFHDTTVEVGGRYNWTSNLSTGLTVSLGGYPGVPSGFSGDAARFDVRWSFADIL
ncbi:MAG: hypothetical protein ABL989_14365 [Gammaproteobacteria bacterium]